MQKFHSIATDRYIPLSFDNAYLFNQYDRVSNFLIFNVDKKYKNFLAKPVKSNYDIDWYNVYSNLEPIEQSPFREFGIKQYWLVVEEVQKHIEELLQNSDANVQYWGAILKTVFNPEDNLIFTNGADVCIVWGWKFENNQNRKPNLLLDNVPASLLPPAIQLEEPKVDIENEVITSADQPTMPSKDEADSSAANRQHYIMPALTVDEVFVEIPERRNFLAFLKNIAFRYWWVLVALLALICLVFFFRSLTFKS